MSDKLAQAPLKAGGVPTILPGFGPVDPFTIRSKLMLEAASHMMTEWDWPYRVTTVQMESPGDEIGTFRLFGANHPDSIRKVHDRQLDIAIMNPGVILSMAYKGVGLFSQKMDVALIAVAPHFDQLAFAVTESSGLKSLDDIREKRFPLRVSVRASQDLCTTMLVEKVLNAHGFSFKDILSWGGSITYDQPMPPQTPPNGLSRIDRVKAGQLDAIFEEGVFIWINAALGAGMRFLDLESRYPELEKIGFVKGKLEKKRFDKLPADVNVVDFSGWPIYTHRNASDLLIRKYCEALEARKDALPVEFGPPKQAPMPLAKMLIDSPATPIDIPFHPAAREVWTKLGYLK